MSTNTPPNPRTILVNELKEAKDKTEHLAQLWKKAESEKSADKFEFLAAVFSNGVPEFKIEKNEKKFGDAIEQGVKCGSTTCMIASGEKSESPEEAEALFNAALEANDYRAANALGVLALKKGDLGEAMGKFELAASHNVAQSAQNLLISRMQASLVNMRKSMQFLQKAMSVFAAPRAPAAEEKKDEKKEEAKK